MEDRSLLSACANEQLLGGSESRVLFFYFASRSDTQRMSSFGCPKRIVHKIGEHLLEVEPDGDEKVQLNPSGLASC